MAAEDTAVRKRHLIQWFAHEELVWRRKNFHGYVETLVSNNLFVTVNSSLHWRLPRNLPYSKQRRHGILLARLRKEPSGGNPIMAYSITSRLPKDYLKQQKRFAIDAIPMMFNQKKCSLEIPIIPESSISKSS